MTGESAMERRDSPFGMRRSSLAALALVFAAIVTACQYDPYTLSYTRTKPDVKELVGSWIATDSTNLNLERTAYSKARPTIVVSADGAIRMSDIPDAWHDPSGQGKGALETFSGTWLLNKHQDWWGLEIRGGVWEGGCSGCLMVLRESPPFRLVIRVGGPDAGVGYEFRKAG